jgi:hypothetical protein
LSKIKSKISPSSIPHNTSGSPRTLGAAMDIFWNNIPCQLPGPLFFSGLDHGSTPSMAIIKCCKVKE